MDLIRDIKGKDALQTLAVASYPLISMSRIIADFYNRQSDRNVTIRLKEDRLMQVIDHVYEGRDEIGFC